MCLTLPPDARVTQASHHGIQALAGLVGQRTANQSLQVWEHGVLMRERLIYLDCFKRNLLPHFVNEQLTRLHRVAGQALYRIADLVVPCNASFNTAWELWLGTDAARLMPLLNALEIEHYPLLQSAEAPKPTAAMLSHVYALKDILTAIRAAAIIVHDYQITDYRLEVYGSLDFDRDYVAACQRLIKQLRLEGNVALRGLGAPIKVPRDACLAVFVWLYVCEGAAAVLCVCVLSRATQRLCQTLSGHTFLTPRLIRPDPPNPNTTTTTNAPHPQVLTMAWIYIQTSISEGLPVSVIEAGLTGKPVVATNVGGCAELLANPNAGAGGEPFGLEGPQPPWFGRLVAPKDAEMIAYAQLEILGYLPTLQVRPSGGAVDWPWVAWFCLCVEGRGWQTAGRSGRLLLRAANPLRPSHHCLPSSPPPCRLPPPPPAARPPPPPPPPARSPSCSSRPAASTPRTSSGASTTPRSSASARRSGAASGSLDWISSG